LASAHATWKLAVGSWLLDIRFFSFAFFLPRATDIGYSKMGGGGKGKKMNIQHSTLNFQRSTTPGKGPRQPSTVNRQLSPPVNCQLSFGILGGAFDPVHNGHLEMARAAMEECGLDRVIFIPAAVSPFKTDGPIAAGADRLEMLNRAINGFPYYEISKIELDRKEISYTIDTIRELDRDYGPELELSLIIGMDNLLSIAGWKDIELLIDRCRFIIITRPEFEIGRLTGENKYWTDTIMESGRGCIISLDIPVSSTAIRSAIRRGEDISVLVPDGVGSYIMEKGLYRN
jgi:nicotinate-nucleotide adenylyltransferase